MPGKEKGQKMKRYFLDLCAGIGGFALGAYWAGIRFDEHYFSEVDEYGIRIYKKRFPKALELGDARKINYAALPGGEWLVTGGFPCQPHSVAGRKQASKIGRAHV
jgi:DNA (cytosine-5)-methyltransferase 1